jgi:hypothetical protein
VAKRFKSVIYDGKQQDAFLMTQNSIERQKDITNMQRMLVVNSVDEIRRNYTGRELERVEVARRLHVMTGRPSKDDFRSMIEKESF